MGKKKGGKKKGGGKKKKGGEPKMTWKEALLAYKINIQEKCFEDVRYEMKALTDMKERHVERNERLLAEQKEYLRNLLAEAKDFEKKLAGLDVIEKSEVISIMKENWQATRQEELDVIELRKDIARKDAEIEMEKKQVEYWTAYRDKHCHDHLTQIHLLEQELVDMQSTFDEMAAHLKKTTEEQVFEIEKQTEETLDKQKYLATEKAIARMDKYSRQEVLDSDWLKREGDMHKNEMEELTKTVERLEKENLEIMSGLFECSVDDLKISRNFYLTQFGEDENLEEDGILEMDLAKLSIENKDVKHEPLPPLAIEDKRVRQEDKRVRPTSAMQRAVEDKVFGLTVALAEGGADDGGEEEADSLFDGELGNEGSDDEDPFKNYIHCDEEDFDDYLHLGPLELKLLSVTGKAVKMYKTSEPLEEHREKQRFKPDKWPVTKRMISKTLETSSPRTGQ